VVRVFADSLNRVGDAEARLFQSYVHARPRVLLAGLPAAVRGAPGAVRVVGEDHPERSSASGARADQCAGSEVSQS
jgi:hypothetical protein